MGSYRIEVSATAEKQILKLRSNDQLRVLCAINRLADEPHPPGCRKLRRHEDTFRIRVGPYRVLYSVESGRLLVIILKVGHRKDVYR